ncbi:hypothetical protein [Aeromonas sp. R5-3]|uniref:hypothetical protein n=1 Tax=Aeromonas sp. R5-3 TaxID=3138469 RepID=UPI0034A2FFAA
MKMLILLLGCTLSLPLLAVVEDRDAKQAKLDAACQQAQQQLVEQGKQQRIDACIKAGGKAAKCQQEFASFGQREGNKRPDLNNLPPCQQADAYRKSYRQ